MEESFPRGGTQKTAEQTNIKKRPKENDNLFSTHYEEEESEIKKKKRKKEEYEKAKPTRTEKGTASAAKQPPLNILRFKNLSVDMLFLGCVKEAKDFELVVSLPHGLTGYVHATSICEAYTKLLNEQVEKDEPLETLTSLSGMYTPGMLVRCAVSSLETTAGGFPSIKLSVNPKLVNKALNCGSLRTGMLLSGCLSSEEDHGYLIDIGVAGTKAFLPHQKAELFLNQAGKGATLRVGQYLNCVIEEVKNDGRIVRLSIAQSDVAVAYASSEQNWSLNNLVPGLVVKAQIEKVDPQSITLSFLSSYTGTVDFLHFEPKKGNKYKAGQEVKACILWVDPSTKCIRLTLRQALLHPGNPLCQLTSDWIGSVLENCTVKTLFKNIGAIFELEGGNLAFAFNHHLPLSKQSTDLQRYKEGTTHTGRVTDYSPMDEMLLLSLKKKIVEGLYLRHEDIQAGQLLEGTVRSLEAKGMVLNITNHLTGLVPHLHLADVLLHHPEKKYSIGSKIRCRVLTVVPAAKKLILTRKKTIINSKLPIIASYGDAKPGLITHGFIVSVQSYGCVVKFYNEVQGLALRRELGSEHIPSPEDIFYKGQVVKIRVLECNPKKEKMLVSFKITDEGETEQEQRYLKKNHVAKQEIGTMVDTKITMKTEKGLNVVILPDDIPAFIPKMHLSDHLSHCELLWHSLEVGDLLPGAMCLSSKGQNILTKKPALISSMEKGQCVKEISEVQVGMSLTGYVKNVVTYGLFVEFPYSLFGLVPKSAISDKFVTNIHDHFVEGQTVVAKVTKKDEQKKRILLTLKVSECAAEDRSAESFSLLSQCFTELQLLRSLSNRKESENPGEGEHLSTLVPGQKLSLSVEAVEEDGSVLFSADQISGAQTVSASKHHIGDKNLVIGQKEKVLVLHVDTLKSHVHVSLKEKLLSKKTEKLVENTVYSAVVQHVAEEFAVVSLEGTAHLAAVPVSSHFNDTYRFESEKLKVGNLISLTLKTTSTEEHGILLAVLNKAHKADQTRLPNTEKSTGMKNGLRIGDVVTGIVKTVKPTTVAVSINDTVVGFLHVSQISDDVLLGSFPTAKLKPKQNVTCRVIGGKDLKTHRFLPISHPNFTDTVPELSMLPSVMDTQHKISPLRRLKSFKAGEKVTCYVLKYNTEKKFLEVEVAPEIRGRVELLLLSKSPKVLKRPEKSFKIGQALSATVIDRDTSGTHLRLSLTDTYSLENGSVTLARVKKVKKGSGITLSLPLGKTGNASIFHINDCYAEASLEKFTPGKFVRCVVLSTSKTIEVSLRQSRLNPKNNSKVVDKELASIGSIEKGQLISGFVGGISDKGVFFRLSSSVVGHIQFNKVTGFYVHEQSLYKKYIPEGTPLTAKVLDIDTEENHVALSLLPEDTGKPDVIPVSAGLCPRKNKSGNEGKKEKRKRTDSESGSQSLTLKKKKRKTSQGTKEDEDSGVEVYCREEEEENKGKKDQKEEACSKPIITRLQVSSGFSWDVSLNTLKTSLTEEKESSSDSDEEDEQPKKKKTKKQIALEKKQAEKELSKLEATFLDPNRQPQSADDFDRLVISSPDSSILWLQYMAFHLHATEIEKARAVAERALKTISFREEQEKLNVWVALLNLENMYGTEETLMKAFERAIQYNEPLKVYQQLADIYIKSEKIKQAEDLYNTMLKRFRQEKSVWLKFATFLLKQGQAEATQRLLQRALKCLPDKEHVDVISKFAQLEFHLGDTERAKALFESTLSSYPKRTDLWSVYIDMMVKHGGSQKEVRDIFERVIHLSLAPKRIKFFFKRYLEYEKKHGSAESVQAVKEKALEYVESKSSLTAT